MGNHPGFLNGEGEECRLSSTVVIPEKLNRARRSAGIYACAGQVLDLHMRREFERFGIDTAAFNPARLPEAREDEPDCAACPLAADVPQEVRVV